LATISRGETLLRQFWFKGLAAGILGHVAFLIDDARTNFNAICAAHTGSIVMMAFFDLAVDTPGHSAHPPFLICVPALMDNGRGVSNHMLTNLLKFIHR
jgi:hypothetical protein